MATSKATMVFTVVILSLLLACSPASTSAAAASDVPAACGRCGGMEVPYPLSTADGCGLASYRSLRCNRGVLEFLTPGGSVHRVLSVQPSAYRLVISTPAIGRDVCHSSDLREGGLKLADDGPFNISTRNTVMLFNCAETILLSPLNCSATSLCRQFEEKMEAGGACRGTLCCTYLKDSAMTSHQIRLREGGCRAYTSVVDMNQALPPHAWNYGVELQWLPPPRSLVKESRSSRYVWEDGTPSAA